MLKLFVVIALTAFSLPAIAQSGRQTARELGIRVGVLPIGEYNAITDVPGVRVGQVTVIQGDSINTGVTVILPPGDNVFQRKVPAAIAIGNAFGKLAGYTQVKELGELESPVVLTCTLCVPRVADAVLTYLLNLPGNENVRSANPLVGETNDGFLNDIRRRSVTEAHVLEALREATSGPVQQGSVGAGRGTQAFGWKGGIGTSSRVLPAVLGGWSVGALVQTNFGGVLTIDGAPVGEELGRYYLRDIVRNENQPDTGVDRGDGSIMIVIATDAPLDSRNMERLARRALAGLARTGSSMTNGSGDYVIAFSTVAVQDLGPQMLGNSRMSPLFQAVIEATEEAIYNSLFMATTVVGHRGTSEALPLEETLDILRRYGVVPN